MHARTIAVAACLAALALGPSAALAASDGQVATAVAGAAGWLRAQQAPDGSLGPEHGLDPAWALIGLEGAGVHAADLGSPSAQDYYAALWAGPDDGAWSSMGGAPSATDYERAILIAHAAGIDPLRISAQQNLLAKLAGAYRDGWFTSQVSVLNHTLFGLLALEQEPVPAALVQRTARIVETNQHDDGGYTSFPATSAAAKATASNVDSTGVALAGLCGAGRTLADPSVALAVAFLRAHGLGAGNVDAAAWVLDGLAACGLRRGGAGWSAGDETAIDWLLSGQLSSGPDAGAWAANGTPNAYATQDALRALADPGFAAAPPPRADPLDPLLRPGASVADGTTVPVVLALDPGAGDARLCSTTAPSGASLTSVLAAARAASTPPGCLDGVATDASGWLLSLDGGPEQPAAAQPVPYGDVVALRYGGPPPAPPVPPVDPPPGPSPHPRPPAAKPRTPVVHVSCRITGRRERTVVCVVHGVSARARAQLVRNRHTWASGTSVRLHAANRLPGGRYVLILGRTRIVVRLAAPSPTKRPRRTR